MTDIVERLKLVEEDYADRCSCNFEGCRACRLKSIVSAAAREIEELRSLIKAMKENR